MDKNKYLDMLDYVDYQKICSSLTLFYYISKNELFKYVIDKYYGEFDNLTLDIINTFGDNKIETEKDIVVVRKLWEKYL